MRCRVSKEPMVRRMRQPSEGPRWQLGNMSSQPSPSAYDDARIAHFEREENFRWISSFLATTSSVTLNERVPEAIEQAINAFGELSEIAHGSVDPSWIFILENRKTLGRRGFPLEQYPTLTREVEGQLEDLELVERFHGTRGSLQGYCCLRMKPRTPAYDTSGESSCASKRHFMPTLRIDVRHLLKDHSDRKLCCLSLVRQTRA